MGFQIPAMSVGNSINTVSHDSPAEKPAHHTQDQKNAALKEFEASLPGNGKANTETIKTATADLQNISLAFNRRLQFIVDPESREILIKVIDSETDKVIKVLPPEELQRLHSRIRETMGFLFDERV